MLQQHLCRATNAIAQTPVLALHAVSHFVHVAGRAGHICSDTPRARGDPDPTNQTTDRKPYKSQPTNQPTTNASPMHGEVTQTLHQQTNRPTNKSPSRPTNHTAMKSSTQPAQLTAHAVPPNQPKQWGSTTVRREKGPFATSDQLARVLLITTPQRVVVPRSSTPAGAFDSPVRICM